MEPVFITGAGMTNFGVLEETLVELAQQATLEALKDNSLIESPIDHLIVGSQNPEQFTKQGHTSTLLADYLGFVPAGATRIETGPSSGSSAFESAFAMISAGMVDTVLVIGVEKMSHLPRNLVSKILARMLSYENEILYGATPTALAALMARKYMHDYGLTRDELSLVPVKAHRNGAKNPFAQFQNEVSIKEVNESPVIANPLRLYDCCAISDGAAALILASERIVKEHGLFDSSIKVLGIGHGTDYLAVQHRQSLTSLNATRVAARKAFNMAGINPKQIDVCEVHDAFSILELLNMEDIGLVEKGTAINSIKDGTSEVLGETPVNPSGGIKARGHPTGSTGVAQIRDIVIQLKNQAPTGLQVDNPQIGLTHNIGGFGNNVVVSILSHN